PRRHTRRDRRRDRRRGTARHRPGRVRLRPGDHRPRRRPAHRRGVPRPARPLRRDRCRAERGDETRLAQRPERPHDHRHHRRRRGPSGLRARAAAPARRGTLPRAGDRPALPVRADRRRHRGHQERRGRQGRADLLTLQLPVARLGNTAQKPCAPGVVRMTHMTEQQMTQETTARQEKARPERFDNHADECNADPVAYYAAYRESCPVGRTSAHGGFVYTTRYADVARIARDDDTFSSSREATGADGVAIVIPSGPGLEQYPIELDPPRSTGYRDLINPLLTPEAVDRLRPMIARHAARAVDAFIELGSADFVRDLTNPVPAAVTLDWLGFPEEDWARLAGPVHDIFAAPAGSERAQRGAQGLAYMERRIRELIRERRESPADDAGSELVAARNADGEPFTEDELVSVIGLLIAGGVDTTTSLTGSTLVHLSRNPHQRQRLIESPDLLERATEEFLRAFAPSQSMARTVRADTEVGGCPVRAGERILIPWVAANHDPAVFPDPEEIRLDRDASRHLSFGIGSPRCAGARRARAAFREMMTQVLTRLPDFRVLEDGLVAYPTSGNQRGWDAIPAVFTPGPRSTGTTVSAPPLGVAYDLTVTRAETV